MSGCNKNALSANAQINNAATAAVVRTSRLRKKLAPQLLRNCGRYVEKIACARASVATGGVTESSVVNTERTRRKRFTVVEHSTQLET
jgi:hypothetical protein